MDWKQDGFTFQFSSTMAEEAETTILTLLPLLEHFYPTSNVRANFTKSAVKRFHAMEWDDHKKMIIDTSAPEESAEIEDEENLMGFEFSATAEEELKRNMPTFGPNDEDSVSTLKSKDATIRSEWRATTQSVSATTTQQSSTINLAHSQNSQDDSMSLLSAGTTVTMESIHMLEGKISGLTTQLLEEKQRSSQQFNLIMQALQNMNNVQQNDQSQNISATGKPRDESNTSGQGS